MRRHRLILLAAVVGAILGCSSPTSPTSQLLSLSSNGTTLTLENPNSWTVYYLALNANSLALYDGSLCDDPSANCPHVPARGTLSIPYSEIWAYSTDKNITVQVFQWRLDRQINGQYKPADVQSQQMALE